MDGIRIEKIVFKNYRQYGTFQITFSPGDDCFLSVVEAQNGTGKTTLLNAITWCLYEKEYNISEDEDVVALPLLNTDCLDKANDGDRINVGVTLLIDENGEKSIEFCREIEFKIQSGINGEKNAFAGTSNFKVTVTNTKDLSNSDVRIEERALATVKQYFDSDIKNFYFFDGEKLSEFFSDSVKVKDSIYNISQVNLLQNVCDHSKRLIDERLRKLKKKGSNTLTDLLDEKQRLLDESLALSKDNSEISKKIAKNKDEYEAIDKTLTQVKPIEDQKKLQLELDNKLSKLDSQFKSLKVEKSQFIRRYIVLLNLYKQIKSTYELIEKKEESGELPPQIDPKMLRDIIDGSIHECPVCGTTISPDIIDKLNETLKRFSWSTETGTYLSSIKGFLLSAMKEAEEYNDKKEGFSEREKFLRDEISKTREDLIEVNKFLEAFKNDDKVDVEALERKSRSLKEENNNHNIRIGAQERQIQLNTNRLRDLEKEIEEESKKSENYKEMQDELKVLNLISDSSKKIKDTITSDMKDEIETITWNFFDKMIWKSNTFGSVKINENYRISVFDRNNHQMTGSLSETEKTALAYAYILAIHKVSGKNCPLVIDSPLGRVSDENRRRMAEALKDVSENKQIIMLFTPDEYSEQVRRIYASTVDSHKLNLSDNEKYVEGAE